MQVIYFQWKIYFVSHQFNVISHSITLFSPKEPNFNYKFSTIFNQTSILNHSYLSGANGYVACIGGSKEQRKSP